MTSQTRRTKKTTRVIAGHAIQLTVGRRYLASRPMATGVKGERFTVKIHDITDVSIHDITAGFTTRESSASIRFPGLSYDEANDLINAFNNGTTSFAGRTWE